MRRLTGTFALLLMAVALLPLAGCFTGIESTPRITANDVKKQKIVVSPEQEFIADISPAPLSGWEKGKRFLVTDDRIALVFGASAQGYGSLKGEELVYQGFDTIPAITGDGAAILYFSTSDGGVLRYKVSAPVDVILARPAMELPFSIDLDVVARVCERLVTKRVYILTSIWLDSRGNQTTGRKFVPVTITDVRPGNANYPLIVAFVDGASREGGVYMSLGSSRQSTRNFDTLFSFADPRMRYPDISDENWLNIVDGKVVLDMTREECRLALGSPKEIDRRPGYGGVAERWTYTDGVYLLFEDGLLRDFRR